MINLQYLVLFTSQKTSESHTGGVLGLIPNMTYDRVLGAKQAANEELIVHFLTILILIQAPKSPAQHGSFL